jgi:hypothetical protein
MNYQIPSLAKLELPSESFVAFLRAAPNDMPTFSADVLSDKDATDIYAFLQSLPGRRPVKDFPLLSERTGKFIGKCRFNLRQECATFCNRR